MKKYIIAACSLACMLAGSVTLSSCSDVDDIQDLKLARVLSPTGITARADQTNPIITVSWDEMSNATAYVIEAFAEDENFEGTPEVTGQTEETTYVLTGLSGETTYYIRVKGIADGIEDSRWVTVSRQTASEQIMKAVNAGDIQSDAVTVYWTAGETAAKLVATPVSNSSAKTVEKDVTADEIAAGKATLTGLTPETDYRIALLHANGKTRGYATFTTNIDLSDATLVTPSDNLVQIIADAAPGAKLKLAGGTYTYNDQNIHITKDITIGAAESGNRPVINSCLHLEEGASLYAFQIIFDGEGTEDQTFGFKTDNATYDALTVDGCEIRNYTKGVMYLNVAALVKKILFKNCIIHDIECNGGDLFDSRKGGVNEFELSSSTIYNSAASRQIFRFDDASSTITANASFLIEKNTFYNVGNGDASAMILYIRFAGNTITFRNNVVAKFNNVRGFSNNAATAIPNFSNNFYYDTKNLVSLADGNTESVKFFDEKGTVLEADPFKDAENADFTVTNDEIIYGEAGDPRWR